MTMVFLIQLPSQDPGFHLHVLDNFANQFLEKIILAAVTTSRRLDYAWALQALKFDQKLLNQVPSKVIKFVQERDKEVFFYPACILKCFRPTLKPAWLHWYWLALALEQTRCPLGSANAQLTILRRQRILAAKIGQGSPSQSCLYPVPKLRYW